MSLKSNQVRAIKLGTSSYTREDTQFTKKGTLMRHYALVEFASKEMAEEYETSKGANFRTVKEGEHKGKPLHFTSQNFEGVNEGDEIIFDLINDRLQVSETLEEREAKDTARKAKLAEEKALIAKEERLFALASKHGVKLSLS